MTTVFQIRLEIMMDVIPLAIKSQAGTVLLLQEALLVMKYAEMGLK